MADRAKFHFYLAKVYAKQGMGERALVCLRKALEEGFTKREKLIEEPEFANLRSNAEFQDLLRLPPRAL